jgi:hypothetical protein
LRRSPGKLYGRRQTDGDFDIPRFIKRGIKVEGIMLLFKFSEKK